MAIWRRLRSRTPLAAIYSARKCGFRWNHEAACEHFDLGSKWNQSTTALSRLPPTNGKEAAILVTIDPGSYSAVIRGKKTRPGSRW